MAVVLERKVAAQGATTSVTLSATPAAGQGVLVVVARRDKGNVRNATVSGGGATWTQIYRHMIGGSTYDQTIEVWKGTGFTSAGPITQVSPSNAQLSAFHIDGNVNAAVAQLGPVGPNGDDYRIGPSTLVPAGSAVIGVIGVRWTYPATVPNVKVPAAGWSTVVASGEIDGWQQFYTLYRNTTVEETHRLETTDANTPAAVVQIVVPPTPLPGAIQYVGTSQDESTNPSDPTSELACPAGVIAGDLLVALVGVGQSTGNAITPPAGWTKLGGDYLVSGSGANAHRGSLFTKVATNAEPATYVFSHDPGYSFGVLGAYRGVQLAGFQLAGSGYVFEAPNVHTGGAATFSNGPLEKAALVQLSYCTRYSVGASTWNVAGGVRRNAGERYLHVDKALSNVASPHTPPNHSHNDYYHAWAAATVILKEAATGPKLQLGSAKVDKLYLGSTAITTAYLGTTKL